VKFWRNAMTLYFKVATIYIFFFLKFVFSLYLISFKVRTLSRNLEPKICAYLFKYYFSKPSLDRLNNMVVTRWLYNGVLTSGLIHRENGRRFLTPLVCAGCLRTGLEAACSGKSGGVRLRSAREKAASHPVSRQPAQTSCVKIRLPFLMGVVTRL